MTPRNVLKDGFTASDFRVAENSDDAAEIANALLEQAKRDAVRVYVIEENVADGRFIWNASEIRDNRDTHTALLINIEKIETNKPKETK